MPIPSTQSSSYSSAWVINKTQETLATTPTDGILKKVIIVTSRATANTFLTGLAAIEYVVYAILTVVSFGRSETIRSWRIEAYTAMGTAFKGIAGYRTPQEVTPPNYLQRMLASIRQYKIGSQALDYSAVALKFLKDQSLNVFKYCREHKIKSAGIAVGGIVGLTVVLGLVEMRASNRELRELCSAECAKVYNTPIAPEKCIRRCIFNTKDLYYYGE